MDESTRLSLCRETRRILKEIRGDLYRQFSCEAKQKIIMIRNMRSTDDLLLLLLRHITHSHARDRDRQTLVLQNKNENEEKVRKCFRASIWQKKRGDRLSYLIVVL